MKGNWITGATYERRGVDTFLLIRVLFCVRKAGKDRATTNPGFVACALVQGSLQYSRGPAVHEVAV